ncbi:thiamine transporter substrate binding subunit [Haematobacter massiliensis]|uniref:Thiamine-binding periplasmic protein n=1 Tax=Haematobacter massiliensis TaxID=195105 RepID=A0A086Y847_9RHOB|nr:thiamine ABC transporter substrate binding subunit [Haematobacter massiliensis]KFI30447.1 thiamine ABC transporter substrate-binding protein [Haematobacter massiliensis]OWJ70926.1 thiamine transporter substrate binding subunit [Haematobacter massiliensis]OWJ87467.1 thiamine transporter substrate binding subunit [Haematobacter massiliensis]QBJ24920.1 thiamine ABC transporter substrate binding subunit [Haematobacter massiliensis]
MRLGLIAAVFAGLLGQGAAAAPVLTVYTYDSFASEWGPGPKIKALFEAECGCTVDFVTAGDGASLLGRLRLEGIRSPADVVVGLDNNLIDAARESGLFAPHGLGPVALDVPVEVGDDTFLPFDWGYFAFVYDRTKLSDPPDSFGTLIGRPDSFKIIIQDPRSSTPGLGLLLWVKAAYGDRAPEIWKGLAPHVLTVTPGWSEAYGMFLKGEADMVLSYTTSPAYHIVEEQDDTKAAAMFAEGHYLQVEVAARLASSQEQELAGRFLSFLLSDAAQAVLPTTNWMYPAITPAEGLPAGFEKLSIPERALILTPEEARSVRDSALDEWLGTLSR